MSNASATIASTEKRVLVGLGVTGQSVARWWQRQGIGFTAIDTRAELADDPAVFAHVNPQTTAFGDIDSAMLDGCTDMIVSPGSAGSPIGDSSARPGFSYSWRYRFIHGGGKGACDRHHRV